MSVPAIGLVLEPHHSCPYGADNAWIKAIATGGNTVYVYSWTGPNGYTSTLATPINLKPGEYTCSVTDSIGTTPVVRTILITECPAETALTNFQIQLQNFKCCAGKLAAKAAIAMQIGTKCVGCLDRKLKELLRLISILDDYTEDGDSCFSLTEIQYIQGLANEICCGEDCGCSGEEGNSTLTITPNPNPN